MVRFALWKGVFALAGDWIAGAGKPVGADGVTQKDGRADWTGVTQEGRLGHIKQLGSQGHSQRLRASIHMTLDQAARVPSVGLGGGCGPG